MTKIIDIYLKKMSHVLAKRDVKVEISPEAKAYLAEKGYDKKFGARPLRRVVEQDLETPIAKLLMKEPDTKEVKFTADDQHVYLNGDAVLTITPKADKTDKTKSETKENKD